MLDADQYANLYIECARYRIAVERYCKRHGGWDAETFAILVVEMAPMGPRIGEGRATELLKVQYLLEIGHTYARDVRARRMDRGIFLSNVARILRNAAALGLSNKDLDVEDSKLDLMMRITKRIKRVHEEIARVGA